MTGRPETQVKLGITLNVLACVLFAIMYVYVSYLDALSAQDIYGWRILLTVPALTLMALIMGCSREIIEIGKRLRAERWFWAKRLVSAFLLGLQQWVFMWAPLHGHALDVSIGYFLLPIVAVVVGRIAFAERITRLQTIACVIALTGVIFEIFRNGGFAWPTLVVCLGYPYYYYFRRVIGTNNLGGLWYDMMLNLPIGVLFILVGSSFQIMGLEGSNLPLLIAGLGVLSAAALALAAISANKLSLPLYGLLTYVEPVLLVLGAFIIGESIADDQLPMYIAIWLAVSVLVVEGFLSYFKSRGPATEPGPLGA